MHFLKMHYNILAEKYGAQRIYHSFIWSHKQIGLEDKCLQFVLWMLHYLFITKYAYYFEGNFKMLPVN